MKTAFYSTSDSLLDFDPLLDIYALEDEAEAVSDLRNLYTVEHE